MYQNLIDTMEKENIKQYQIADLLGVRNATVCDKINGVSRGFYFDEAIKIKKVLFPKYQIEFLFEKKENINGYR